MIVLPILALLLLFDSAAAGTKSKRQELIEKLFNGYDYKARPPSPTAVTISVGVQHLSFEEAGGIDGETATMMCTMHYTWQDPRLMWNPQDWDGIKKLSLPANHKLWKPQYMTNMDGKNHRIASTAHLLRGFELEVKDPGREGVAYINMIRRVELEVVCEKESSFPTILKCVFHGLSSDDISLTRWSYLNLGGKTGFLENNTTGTGLYEIESVFGVASGNYYNPRKQYNEISVSIRLREKQSLRSILSTAFLCVMSILVLIALLLPSNHEYLNAFVMIMLFLLILIPSQLIFTTKSNSSTTVPSQTRVYALLFVLTTLVLPIQKLVGCATIQEKAQPIPSSLTSLHSKLFPYTKDYELPFMLILLKTLLVAVIVFMMAILFIM